MPSFLQRRAPKDGKQYDCQCARCGSTLAFESCSDCGGDGVIDELDIDDGWDDGDDGTSTCVTCTGDGSWPVCISTDEWCQANPLPGRESIPRSSPEWFEVGRG